VAVFALGVLIMTAQWPSVGLIVLGVIVCGCALVLLPHAATIGDDPVSLEQLPALNELVITISTRLGGRPIPSLIVDESFNAFYYDRGWRRTPTIGIGLPFWIALDAEERIALISHEIAHGVNGDFSRGFIIGTAVHTQLDKWLAFLQRRAYVGMTFADIMLYLMLWLVSGPVALIRTLLVHLLWQDSQRAEYLADHLAASLAGTDSIIRVLERLDASDNLDRVLQRHVHSNFQKGTDIMNLWRSTVLSQLSQHREDTGQRKKLLPDARLDATHPPTAHRIELLRAHPKCGPLVAIDQASMARIDAELQRFDALVGQRLIARYARD
jgi:Zn-dependent protease with chaperone function